MHGEDARPNGDLLARRAFVTHQRRPPRCFGSTASGTGARRGLRPVGGGALIHGSPPQLPCGQAGALSHRLFHPNHGRMALRVVGRLGGEATVRTGTGSLARARTLLPYTMPKPA